MLKADFDSAGLLWRLRLAFLPGGAAAAGLWTTLGGALAPLALGALTLGATVREMSAAYATFANNGTWREPRLYTKVYNSDGELVVDNTQDSRKILGEKG